MTRPVCTRCDDPHRSRMTPEWGDIDFDECAHFSALAADEARDRSDDERYLASARKFRAAVAARRTAATTPAPETPMRNTP